MCINFFVLAVVGNWILTWFEQDGTEPAKVKDENADGEEDGEEEEGDDEGEEKEESAADIAAAEQFRKVSSYNHIRAQLSWALDSIMFPLTICTHNMFLTLFFPQQIEDTLQKRDTAIAAEQTSESTFIYYYLLFC